MHFRKNLPVRKNIKIRVEKFKYHINREAVKISALLSGKNDRYEHVTDEEILPSDQSRIKEQANLHILH